MSFSDRIKNKAKIGQKPVTLQSKLKDADTVTLDIPYPTFQEWKIILKESPSTTFMDILNSSVNKNVVYILDPHGDIEKLLKNVYYMINSKFGQSKGGSQNTCLKCAVYRLNLNPENGELQNVLDLQKKCEKLFEELVEAQIKVEEGKQKCVDLEKDVVKLNKRNQALVYYMFQVTGNYNTDFKFDFRKETVGERQQTRRLLKAHENVERSLWFLELVNLKLELVKVTYKITGKLHKLGAKKYGELSEEDKNKIESIVYLQYRFCTGDNFYHEMTFVENSLPKSYIIKPCRKDLNKLSHIERTPGVKEGVQVSLREELSNLLENFDRDEQVNIRISGDGASVSRLSNFTTISFSVISKNVGNTDPNTVYPLAVVKTTESYESIAESFADIIQEVNTLVDEGKIDIGGTPVNMEVFLSGDYKFLLVVMGLACAVSAFDCLWCLKHPQREHYKTS